MRWQYEGVSCPQLTKEEIYSISDPLRKAWLNRTCIYFMNLYKATRLLLLKLSRCAQGLKISVSKVISGTGTQRILFIIIYCYYCWLTTFLFAKLFQLICKFNKFKLQIIIFNTISGLNKFPVRPYYAVRFVFI